jgi:hypothetical protein
MALEGTDVKDERELEIWALYILVVLVYQALCQSMTLIYRLRMDISYK